MGINELDERAALRRAAARFVSAALECSRVRGLPLPAMVARLEALAALFEEAASEQRAS